MISGSSKARLGYMCPVDGLRQPRPPPRGNCPGRRPQAPACFKWNVQESRIGRIGCLCVCSFKSHLVVFALWIHVDAFFPHFLPSGFGAIIFLFRRLDHLDPLDLSCLSASGRFYGIVKRIETFLPSKCDSPSHPFPIASSTSSTISSGPTGQAASIWPSSTAVLFLRACKRGFFRLMGWPSPWIRPAASTDRVTCQTYPSAPGSRFKDSWGFASNGGNSGNLLTVLDS